MNIFYTIFHSIYNTILEAIFPVAPAERWIFETNSEVIFSVLPRATRSPIPEACSIFSYKDERVWRLIWSIKYKKSGPAIGLAGYALYRMIRNYAQVVGNIMIIPMPVSKQRRRERGFNQCELLTNEIEHLALSTQTTSKNRLQIVHNLLTKKKHTSRQTLKDRNERTESAHDIFAVNEEIVQRNKKEDPGFTNKIIIIIDDVITTGSTMKEAIDTLKQAGFTNTWGLSVAH